MAIGSVAFDVVPDSTGFYAKFIAKTRGDMEKAGVVLGKAVGSKLGDTAGVEARARLQAALKDLKATVNLDTGKAEAQAAALRASLDKVSGKGISQSTKETHLLSTALLAAGTAAVPLAGVATGAMVGLGAAAGVAVVGILGVRDAMKEGTALGRQYQAAFKPLVSEFGQLKQIAAQGLFAGINSGVKSLKPLFPVLNRDVALFSAQMGSIAGHVGPGLVSLFTRLNPLFATIGDQMVHGSQGFEQWAKSSQAVGRFVAYVQTTLPQVEQTVGSLITSISHIAIAAEPFGGTTLTAIRLFSGAINAIPIGVLQTLVPLLLGLKVGNTLSNSLGNAAVKIEGFGKKAGTAAGAAAGASGVFGKLGGVVGKLGPAGYLAGAALGGLSVIMGRSKQGVIEETKRVNDLVQAIENGTVAAGAWNNALETGASGVTKVGLSQRQIVTALTGTQGQYQSAQRRLDAYKSSEDDAALAGGRFGASSQEVARRQQEVTAQVSKLKSALAESRSEYEAAKATVAGYAREQGNSILAAQIADESYLKIAHSLGLTGDEYISASLAADKSTESVKSATAAMVLQNDAAGLLDQALQKLGGNSLGVAQATTAAATATAGAVKAFHDNGRTLDQNTEKGRANATALQQQASSAIQLAKSIEQQTGSTVKGNSALAAQKSKLEDSLRAQGLLNPAVQQYIDYLYRIPARKSTRVDANTASAFTKVSNLIGLENVSARTRRVIIGADTGSAYEKLRRLNAYLQSMLHPVITPTVHSGPTAGHGRLIQADGGVVDYYANGALINSVRAFADGAHVAQIAPAGAMRVFAEPETGGEAYIPMASSKRARSQSILSEVAARFGDTYVPTRSYADGGINARPVSSTSAPMQVVIQVATPQIWGGTTHQLAAAIREVVVPGLEQFVGAGGRLNISRGIG